MSHQALASAALPSAAPPRLRVSRSDARGDVEDTERCSRRMRARTPAHPGCRWFNHSVHCY